MWVWAKVFQSFQSNDIFINNDNGKKHKLEKNEIQKVYYMSANRWKHAPWPTRPGSQWCCWLIAGESWVDFLRREKTENDKPSMVWKSISNKQQQDRKVKCQCTKCLKDRIVLNRGRLCNNRKMVVSTAQMTISWVSWLKMEGKQRRTTGRRWLQGKKEGWLSVCVCVCA